LAWVEKKRSSGEKRVFSCWGAELIFAEWGGFPTRKKPGDAYGANRATGIVFVVVGVGDWGFMQRVHLC